MLLSRSRVGSSPGAQLQGSWRRVRADVVDPDSSAKPGRVAAGVGAGLAGMGSRIGLLKKRFGQDLFSPRTGLGVHDRVEESLQISVQILSDMDHLLSRRGRDGSRIHFAYLEPEKLAAGPRKGREAGVQKQELIRVGRPGFLLLKLSCRLPASLARSDRDKIPVVTIGLRRIKFPTQRSLDLSPPPRLRKGLKQKIQGSYPLPPRSVSLSRRISKKS